MKKAVSLILVIGVVVALFTLAACGDRTAQDMTTLLEDGSTLMEDMSEDLSEDLSEAFSDENTTEETTEEVTDETTDITDITDETQNGLVAE